MAGSTRKGKSKGAYTEKRLAGLVPWKPGAPSTPGAARASTARWWWSFVRTQT